MNTDDGSMPSTPSASPGWLCLAGLTGTSTVTLRTIRSHPVAMQRCARLLRKLHHCATESHSDPLAAARSVAEQGDPTVAALCSEATARHAGLRILIREVADHHYHFTRILFGANRADAHARSRSPRQA
jgi:prephenate dehydratase